MRPQVTEAPIKTDTRLKHSESHDRWECFFCLAQTLTQGIAFSILMHSCRDVRHHPHGNHRVQKTGCQLCFVSPFSPHHQQGDRNDEDDNRKQKRHLSFANRVHHHERQGKAFAPQKRYPVQSCRTKINAVTICLANSQNRTVHAQEKVRITMRARDKDCFIRSRFPAP